MRQSGTDDAEGVLTRKIEELFLPGSAPTLVILPSQLRDGKWYYSENDIESLKIARHVGLDAAYLDPAAERQFVAEYSADIAIEVAIAVLANISADAIVAVGRYVMMHLDRLASNGLISRVPQPRVRIQAKVIHLSETGLYAEDLEITATGDEVASEIARILGGKSDGTARPVERPRVDEELGRDVEGT